MNISFGKIHPSAVSHLSTAASKYQSVKKICEDDAVLPKTLPRRNAMIQSREKKSIALELNQACYANANMRTEFRK